MGKTLWPKDRIIKIAKRCKYRSDLKKKFNGAYHAALKIDKLQTGFMDQLFPENRAEVWLDSELALEAGKYSSRKAFETNSNGAYYAAQRRKILDNICAHMGEKKNKKKTVTEMRSVFKQYNTIRELKRSANGVYQAALAMDKVKPGTFEKLSSHMNYVVDCRELAFQKELHKKLIAVFGKNAVYKEYQFSSKSKAKVDFYIRLSNFSFAIELKHDDSYWSPKQIKTQVDRYTKVLNKEKKFDQVYVVSPRGRYGQSLDTFFKLAKTKYKGK